MILNKCLVYIVDNLWNLILNKCYNNFLFCFVLFFVKIIWQNAFGSKLKSQFILLFSLFLLLSMASLHFLVLFMGSTVLFQLIFTFIYNISSKKFSISVE